MPPKRRAEPNDPRPAVYVGVDPGGGGGTAVVYGDGRPPDVWAHSLTLRDRWDRLRSVALRNTLLSQNPGPRYGLTHRAYAVLEKVHAMPAQGVSSTFAFGASFGELRGLLVAAGIPFEEVTPQKWQAAFGLRRGGDEGQTAWKNRLKARAQELFPGVKVTLAVADALLISEFCRRKRTGTL